MAQTTIELRRLLTLPGFTLFDFPYQFDDVTFKAQLEKYIIDFFYDNEIAFETPDMFKRKFQSRWQRIIPYYNKLYNTTLLQYNPLINSKMTEALEQLATASSTQDSTTATTGSSTNTTDGTATNSSTADTLNNTKGSDYPQQPIAGGNYLSNEATTDSTQTTTGENTTLATTTADDESSSTGNTTASSTNNSNYTKTVEGLTGTTYQQLITLERENLMRIQDLIIAEMKPCFMMVY